MEDRSITQPDEYGAVPNESYSWNQIKDYYIPFLKLINARYVLGDEVYFKVAEGADDVAFKQFEIEDVIDDKITSDSIYSVSIKVSSKK